MTNRGSSKTSATSSTSRQHSCQIPGSNCRPAPTDRVLKKYAYYRPYQSKTKVPDKKGTTANAGPTTRPGNAYPVKKLANAAPAKKTTPVKPVYVDVNNSSNPARATKSASEGNQASSPFANDTANIFKASTRCYKEIAADVVRADCMNHGYRTDRTVGEGAYAKVKLADVLPSKLARNPVMAERASTRHYKEIAADVVRADCMNHGYRTDRTVGEGAYAKVKLADVLPSKLARNPVMAEIAQEYDGNLQVAIKVIENKHVPKEFLKKFLPRELSNHCPLPPHINVVRVLEEFRTTDRIYVVMEYCSKGDLLDLINEKISSSCRGLGEELSRRLFIMMADGVHHIHHNGIVHRDLKCENILMDRHNTIKITDFGFSTKFEHGKSALLKTSCGSYAYTAPEVIKMVPYDGIKSDVWSLGVILFAMLNGRLPFNDSQLNELEEDMKMQRLRFERHVSFESMVLVRRILQYNPTSRPTTDEILTDPWLTGKKHIPRQMNKPKWINPYNAAVRKDEGDGSGGPAGVLGSNNPVYYKASSPEHGPESTITVNHDKNETVVLKSRTGNKKNIWTSGPPQAHRPNTWPRSEKDKVSGTTTSNRGSTKSQLTSTVVRKATKTNVVPRPPTKNGTPKKGVVPPKGGPTATKGLVKGRADCVRMSKWFIERYMHAAANVKKKRTNKSECGCCKAEAALSSDHASCCEKDDTLEIEEELDFAVDADVDSPSSGPEFEDIRFPSPVKNEPEMKTRPTSTASSSDRSSTWREAKSGPEVKAGTRTCSSAGSVSKGASRIPTVTRKPAVKSANVRSRPTRMDLPGPVTSRTPEPAIKMKYLVNQSTSPATRVKYFRDRLMKLYGNNKVVATEGANGLPPLQIQSIQPSSGPASPASASPEPSATSQTSQRAAFKPMQPRSAASTTKQTTSRSHQPTSASSTKQQTTTNKSRQPAHASNSVTSQKNRYKSGQARALGISRGRRVNSGSGRAPTKPVQRVVVHSSLL